MCSACRWAPRCGCVGVGLAAEGRPVRVWLSGSAWWLFFPGRGAGFGLAASPSVREAFPSWGAAVCSSFGFPEAAPRFASLLPF